MSQPFSPFGHGAVSLRLYAQTGATANEIVDALLAQARAADAAGFDGITVSEHHGGFAGYLPVPLQVAGWVLDACPNVWAAPAPLLLTLRPAGLVAEEVAWLAARHRGRVGVGVAAGSLAQDFDIAGAVLDDRLGAHFGEALAVLAPALRGQPDGPLAGDQAVTALADRPVPLVAAAMSRAAVRRAVAAGAGVLSDSLSTRDRIATIFSWYREEGGTGPRVVTRWVWIGTADAGRLATESDRYAGYTPVDRQKDWADRFDVVTGSPEEVADGLRQVVRHTGATALNLRVHIAGAEANEVLDQVGRIGAEVLPALALADVVD